MLAGRYPDRVYRFPQRRIPEDVVGRRWLLDPVRLEFGERTDPVDSLRNAPDLISVDRQRQVADDRTGERQASAIIALVAADLQLDHRKAVSLRLFAEPGQL